MHEKKNTILIVDSDPQIQKSMANLLDSTDFKIVECLVGKQAAQLNMLIKPDLVLLDLTLADIEGKDVITAIREQSQVPIIILTARKEDDDIIMALNTGASDYIIRPFNTGVLLARIYACLRRSVVDKVGVPEIKNGALRMDLVRHEVFLNDELVGFTPKEYNLLRYFIVHRGKMLSHKQILRDIWGPAHTDDMQYLRVYVGLVRSKIEKNPSLPAFITTAPGVGYRMELSEIAA